MTRGKNDNFVDSVEVHQRYASTTITPTRGDVRATWVRPTGHVPSTKSKKKNKKKIDLATEVIFAQ